MERFRIIIIFSKSLEKDLGDYHNNNFPQICLRRLISKQNKKSRFFNNRKFDFFFFGSSNWNWNEKSKKKKLFKWFCKPKIEKINCKNSASIRLLQYFIMYSNYLCRGRMKSFNTALMTHFIVWWCFCQWIIRFSMEKWKNK